MIGFDIEARPYPGQLVLQDVLTIHGRQFKDAAVIVGSSSCQEFSYRAMPWKRAKALPPPYLGMKLFKAQLRIRWEASEAAGRAIPLVIENVKGAQPWVGRAKAHFGSFYLWGDVESIGGAIVAGGVRFGNTLRAGGGRKNAGGSWFNVANNTRSGKGQNPDGRKIEESCSARRWEDRPIKRLRDAGGTWFNKGDGNFVRDDMAATSGKKRADASAQIAKIPFDLARHIARVFKPADRSTNASDRIPTSPSGAACAIGASCDTA